MGVYGIDFYGVGHFGPDPALVRPDFSVAPFESMPISYSSLHLTWHNPRSADCTQLRLVRNLNNLPQDENDGAQVFVLSNYATTNTNDAITVGSLLSLTDINLRGGFVYYTMFGWSNSSNVWVRCTDLVALVPLNWGYGWRLYNLLPMAYRDADIVLVDPYNPWPIDSPNPPLQRYLQLIGFQFDFIRTELESLMSVNDPMHCSGALLPLMAQMLGLPHEPEVGMQQERQLIQSAVHLYKQKGAPRGITEMVSILTSYPATQLVHHGYNELLCLDDGIMYDAIGTWQVWPPQIPNPYTGVLGNVFPALGGQAAGIALTWIPNLLTASPATTNPLTTYPSNWPLSLQPPYNNTGMRIQGTGAGDYNVTTGGIPITDFVSQTGGQGHITWRVQLWSSVSRTVYLSVWGDVGSGARVQVLPEQSFTETAGQWTMMTTTGTINPYPNSLPGAAAPTGPASYYTLYPQIRIAGAAANEVHYVTICGLFPCTPAQIPVDVRTDAGGYDYPRDVKILLQPQSSNLLSNPVTTFTRANPNPPPASVGIGFDGLTNTQDPNAPSTLNILQPTATVDPASFELGTTGGYLANNATIANSTNFAQLGTHSLAITSTVIGSITNRVYIRYPRWSAVANQVFGVSGYFRPGTTARQVAAYLSFYDAQNNQLYNPSMLTSQQATLADGTTTGWLANLNCTLTNSTAQAQQGANSLAMRATAAGDMNCISTPYMPVTPSTDYVASSWMRAATTGRTCYIAVSWYDVNSTYISATFSPASTDTTTGWTGISGTVTSPANAAFAAATPYVAAAAAGETHYVDTLYFTNLKTLVTETANAWVQSTQSQTAPAGTAQAELRLEIEYPGASGEIHYVDNISVTYTNAVQTCNVSIRYASIEDPPQLLPVNGNAALQITATAPGATIWWGKVTTWSPPPASPLGWFASSRPTPPPAYPAGANKTLTNDWFFGAVAGTNPRNWTDPVWGWFMTNQTFFGVGAAYVNGVWFALPPQALLYGNLAAYNVAAGQPFNFSVYAQYITAQDPSNAQMLLGLRWYYPDGTWAENTYPVMLTPNYVRYSMPNPNDNATAYLGEPPPQQNPPTGILPTLVYPFVRFPLAQNAQFLVNSAMLAPALTLSPYMDSTSYSSASGDFISDNSNASYIYRRRTPRVARLTEQMYRWLPMGSTYSITYASAAITPPLDPTLWP